VRFALRNPAQERQLPSSRRHSLRLRSSVGAAPVQRRTARVNWLESANPSLTLAAISANLPAALHLARHRLVALAEQKAEQLEQPGLARAHDRAGDLHCDQRVAEVRAITSHKAAPAWCGTRTSKPARSSQRSPSAASIRWRGTPSASAATTTARVAADVAFRTPRASGAWRAGARRWRVAHSWARRPRDSPRRSRRAARPIERRDQGGGDPLGGVTVVGVVDLMVEVGQALELVEPQPRRVEHDGVHEEQQRVAAG